MNCLYCDQLTITETYYSVCTSCKVTYYNNCRVLHGKMYFVVIYNDDIVTLGHNIAVNGNSFITKPLKDFSNITPSNIDEKCKGYFIFS